MGRHPAPGSPLKEGAASDRELVRAPLLGEHTTENLGADLGLSENTIKEFHKREVVSSASLRR
jgi:2-methylfumaryl-CoA isomerase